MLAPLLGAALLLQRDTIGIHARWGAFRDRAPTRCYAIAQPVRTGRGATQAPFASVATWPGKGARNQLHLRLSRHRDPGAQVTLSVDERRFRLIAGKGDAWAPDAAADRAIVAAMRGARSMSVETLGADGRPFVDVYPLDGAATAIDAAGVACLR